MSTEDVNSDSQYNLEGNELHENLAWYMQNLNISSTTLVTFTSHFMTLPAFYITYVSWKFSIIKNLLKYCRKMYFWPVSPYVISQDHRNMQAGRDLHGLKFPAEAGCSTPWPDRFCATISVSSLLRCLTTLKAKRFSHISNWDFLHSNSCLFCLILPLHSQEKCGSIFSICGVFLIFKILQLFKR